MDNIVSSTDVPTILRTGNAYHVAEAARRMGQMMWWSHKRQILVSCRVRPAADFTRMAFADRTEGEAA